MRTSWMVCLACAVGFTGCFSGTPPRADDVDAGGPPPPPPPPPAVFNPIIQQALDSEGCSESAMCHADGSIRTSFHIIAMPADGAAFMKNYQETVIEADGYDVDPEATDLIIKARGEDGHPRTASPATIASFLAWMECGLPYDEDDEAAEDCVGAGPGPGPGGVYFKPTIQADLEAQGCLAGCHESGLGGYTVTPMPADDAAWMANYTATTAKTEGASPDDTLLIENARGINHPTPSIDEQTLARWRAWITAGAPFEAGGAAVR